MRLYSRGLLFILAALFALSANSVDAQTVPAKIGELELPVQGISATVQPANPTIPKNTAAGVRIVVSTPTGTLSSTDVATFLGGPFQVQGELSGPGLNGTVTLPIADANGVTPIVDPLLLPIPPLSEAGNYTLSNLRLMVNGRPALDVAPATIPVNVIDQVLITSVETRPLTLDEIKDAGVVLDSSDFLGFEFTIGLSLQSNATTISFPVVFDRNGIPLPLPNLPPDLPDTRQSVPVPSIVPVMLNVTDNNGQPLPVNEIKMPDGTPAPVRIPGVLVIPGDVGFLKQFFSAQLFVANGAPGGSGLSVHDVTGTINLPAAPDGIAADAPLSLPDLHNAPQPGTKPVEGVGPDAKPGTADDVNLLNPGDQGEAEFTLRGDQEGFHPISFDIQGTLDGLAVGPVHITGTAQGGVLVRNPFFDMTFAVPGVVRSGEQFKVFVTVKNISQATANLVKVTLDQAQISGAVLLSQASQTIDTIAGGGSATLTYLFQSQRTGQVVASYLHFDTQDGTTGELRFTLGVGERGVPLSPDTLVLPASVDNLPQTVVEAAMRVLGEGWSIANAPAGTLPSGVIRTSKTVVTQKALALAEAGLRISLGESSDAALRDLLADFYGGSPLDPGFDQLLRTTDAGQNFERAVGAALAQPIANSGGLLNFQNSLSQVFASGTDFIAFAVANGGSAAPVSVSLTDGSGRVSQNLSAGAHFTNDVPGLAQVPIGDVDASPLLGLLTAPGAYPYTLQLTGTGTGTVDLAVTMPHADGNFIRGQITGVPVVAGARARIVLDFSQPDRLVLEQDTNNDGTFATQQPLSSNIIAPSGPQFLSATLIDGATLPGASALGVQMAMLFDRIVDKTSASQVSNYQIPANSVQQAKAQLSGRIVLANLQQPEGPYIPTTASVSGISDARGVVGSGGTKPLQSRLSDPGAIVSGRVFNSDGTPVTSAVMLYSAPPPGPTCAAEANSFPSGVAQIAVNSDGRYQIRYVHQDQCGAPFTISTQDPNTGSLRQLSNFVRSSGEQLVMDFALFGRGTVAGTVRNLDGTPQPGATVVVLSQTDTQVGAKTIADGAGHYSVSGITVGPVSVEAGFNGNVGRGAGNVLSSGSTATVNVTLNSGAINVSGSLLKVVDGAPAVAVPNWPVVYSIFDGSSIVPTPVAVANTDASGNFTFEGVPAGKFSLSSQLTARDKAAISDIGVAGQTLSGENLTVSINTQSFGTANGTVTFADGVTPAAGVLVFSGDTGVLTDSAGVFSLPGLPVLVNPQGISARSSDGLRFGGASVVINQPGQIVNGVKIKLSGLGNATFTVLDGAGHPVGNQAVALLSGTCPSACGCGAQNTAADGTVTFTGLSLGRVDAKAISSGFDVASGNASITTDGSTGFGILRFAGTGIVTGNVLDPDGKPAFGADISLSSNVFDPDSCSLVQQPSFHVQTDTSGNFTLNKVAVGRIGISASQVFFPAPVGAQGNLAKNGDVLNFNLQLVNTTAGVLSGTVFLSDGVTPATAGVEVTATGPLPDVTVKTDASGHYQFAKIFPQGTYTLTVRDAISGGVTQETLLLQAGQDMAHDFRLKGRGTVTVQVVDGFGQPVDSADVKLKEGTFPGDELEDVIQPATQGTVTFQQVFEGAFSVTASDSFGRGGRTSSVLPGPDTNVSVVVQLTKTGTVSGHFFMPDGITPIPFANVNLFAGDRQIGQVTTQSTGDIGAFSFSFVPNGPIRLQAQDPVTSRIGIAAGTLDGAALTLDVTAEGLGSVSGLVTSNGVAQPGANVDIFSGSYHATTTSDPTGHYLANGVPVGHIVVNAGLQDGFLLGTSAGTLAGDGTQLTVDVALRGSGTINGKVLEADGVTPAAASLVTVQVGGAGGGTQSVSTDLLGNFVFAVVPEGTATLHAAVLGGIDEGNSTVDVPAGAAAQATIRLNGVGSITGHTQDAAGNPIAGHLVINGTGAFQYGFVLDTNADGSFSLPTVLAGNFTATLSLPSGNINLFGSAFSSVQPNLNTDVNVQLQPTGSVTGTVFRSDGVTPAAGANVTIALVQQGSIVVQAQTDGSFSASGVPLKSFSVRIDDPISTGEALVSNLSLTTEGQNVDLGRIVLNDTPMAVVSIDPADGSTAVPVAQPVKIAFSNPLQSLFGISFSSTQGSVSLAGSLSPDGKLATFTGTLPDSAQISVKVSTAVSDTLGRHPLQPTTATFQTVDLTPPHVVSVIPVNGFIQAATNSSITVNFSEPLAATTNLNNLIAVSGPAGGIAGTTVLSSPSQAVFSPAAPLPTNANIAVSINGETDLSGNVQTVAFNSSFATIDTVAPLVQMVAPPVGGITNSARPTISFTATDALTGINLASATVSIDGQQVATGTLSFTPAANLADGSHTAVGTVGDRGGNIGSGTGSFIIDTQPPSPAQISGVTEGQILKGTVPISLSATDSGSGVSLIDLLVDGNVFVRAAAPFQISLNSQSLSDGNHTLTARATDAAGNLGGQGAPVQVVVDNVPLSVSFTSPRQGSAFNSQFSVTAAANKAVQRIDFSFAGQVASATASPFTASFSVATLSDGSQTVTATAFDFAGNSASSNLVVVVDKTPPVAPNTNLINAEPPVGGFSQVHGLVGSVEPFASVQITNVTHPAQARATVAGDGTFSTNIAGSVDDILSLVAVDAAGNSSPAASIAIRQTSSLPPANGNTSLTFAGDLVDRVGTTSGALASDGATDAVFTISINVGDGITRTLSRIDLSNGSVTHSTAGAPPIGISSDVTSPFQNHADGTISLAITSGATLTLITSDSGFIIPGNTYTATASFTDGSRFVGTFLFVAPEDRQLVPHSATITANPAVLTPSSTGSGFSTIAITNIRDINGTLVPDGTDVALSVANGASKNGFGDLIPSAGGTIIDGSPAANNQNFKVFSISGGMVTATYSGQPVNPPSLTGTTAVIQMLPADSAGNVLGTEVAATQDINLRAPTDRAIVSASPGSLYADGGDHRSHIVVQVRDSLGNPVPDGTAFAVSAADEAGVTPCCFVRSAGGTILGGTPSASGAQYSIFTTVGGVFEFDYGDAGVAAGTDQTKQVVIAVLNVNANNTVNNSLIGSGNVTLVGSSDVELASSMASVPLVFPGIPVAVDIHHVHDARGNLIPDGSTVLVSAADEATISSCCFIRSAGGSIIDGIASPTNANFRYFTLASNQAAATYTVDGANTVGPGSTAVANVQLAMGDPSGKPVDGRLLKLLPLTLVPPSNAVGNAQPASLLGDGAIHTATVTFKPVLDAFGNVLPDGSNIAVSVADEATVAGCCFVRSAGGQILSGTPSPSGSQYRVHTVAGGAITISYADQNVIATPGQTQIANVQLVEARADGSVPTNTNISTAAIKIAGLTSATVTASPNVVFADGGDHRSTITISNVKDATGNAVPDGTLIGVSAADEATVVGCCFVRSAGGVIVGGASTSPASVFQVFPVQNGQVVVQYSSQGVVVPTGQRTVTIQVAAINAQGGVISNANVSTGSIQLLAPGSATVAVAPADVFADGGAHSSAIGITNLKGSDGTTAIPDGTRVGISVADEATVLGCCFVRSAGGQILSAGAQADDGTAAVNNSLFDLFTVTGGQILATYTDAGIANSVGQTQTVNVQLAPAGANGSITSNSQFANGPLQLRGFGSATAAGPATLSKSGGSATVTFSGIKDTAGHLVPDGTLVAVTAADEATVLGCCFVRSTGGAIVDGSPSPSNASFKIFVVQAGSITITYSAATAGVGTANVQVIGARPDGSVINNTAVSGGVWAINITN